MDVGGGVVAVGDGDEVTVAVGVDEGASVAEGVQVWVDRGVLVGGRAVAVRVDVDVGG